MLVGASWRASSVNFSGKIDEQSSQSIDDERLRSQKQPVKKRSDSYRILPPASAFRYSGHGLFVRIQLGPVVLGF